MVFNMLLLFSPSIFVPPRQRQVGTDGVSHTQSDHGSTLTSTLGDLSNTLLHVTTSLLPALSQQITDLGTRLTELEKKFDSANSETPPPRWRCDIVVPSELSVRANSFRVYVFKFLR